MDDCPRLVSDFCAELRGFCSRLESHCTNLRTSIGQISMPVESGAAARFVDQLNERVLLVTARLETLKSVTMGTVSFHELLGHCNELYKQNEQVNHLLEMEIEQSGYKQSHEFDTLPGGNSSYVEESYEAKAKQDVKDAYLEVHKDASSAPVDSKREDTESSYAGSLTLKDLGLSAAGLAALSSEDHAVVVHTVEPVRQEEKELIDVQPSENISISAYEHEHNIDDTIQRQISVNHNGPTSEFLKPVTAQEFNAAPSWLKWQVSMELLNQFVSKLNHLFSLKADSVCRKPTDDIKDLKPDDLASLAYESQIQKACLLILVKLEKLETGFHDGVTTYAVRRRPEM